MTLNLPLRSMLVVAGLLLFGSVAQATGYRPGFDRQNNVYIDQGAAVNPVNPVTFPGLSAELKVAGRKHNVTFYFVFIEEADENFNANTNFALPVLKDILRSWRASPGFDDDRHVLIVHVRKKGSKFAGKTAVEAGQALKRAGLTGSRFDERNGPVMTAVYDELRSANPNYHKFVLAIARHVNEDLDRNAARNAPGSPSSPGDGSKGVQVLLVVVVVMAGVFMVFLVFSFSRSISQSNDLTRGRLRACLQERASKAIASKEALGAVSGRLEELTRSGAYTGETLVALKDLVDKRGDVETAIATLLSVNSRIEEMLNRWFRLDQASREIDYMVRIEHYKGGTRFPKDSTQRISALLDGLNLQVLEAELESLSGKLQQSRLVSQSIADYQSNRDAYKATGLPAQRFDQEAVRLAVPIATLNPLLATDPVKALGSGAETFKLIESESKLLAASLRAHSGLKTAASDLEAALALSKSKRASAVQLHYPGKIEAPGLHTIDPVEVPVVYHEGEDPAVRLQEAQTAIANAQACLQKFQTLEAEDNFKQAVSAIEAFTREEATIDASKTQVENSVVKVESGATLLLHNHFTMTNRLAADLEEFSQETDVFAAVRQALADVRENHARLVSALRGCSALYQEQRFVRAATELACATEALSAGNELIRTIAADLNKLAQMKTRALQTAERAPVLRETLNAPFPKGSSAACTELRNKALAALANLVLVIAEKTPNWRDAFNFAVEVDTNLSNLGVQLKQDAERYKDAQEKLAKAKRNNIPSASYEQAVRAADSGDYTMLNTLVAAYLVAAVVSSGSSSSGSSCSSSSCGGSSCGGGGCGGGGCGGGG